MTTAEQFEKIFGLEEGSLVDIKFDQDQRVLHIYNTDQRMGHDIAEGQHLPGVTPIGIEKRLQLLRAYEHFASIIEPDASVKTTENQGELAHVAESWFDEKIDALRIKVHKMNGHKKHGLILKIANEALPFVPEGSMYPEATATFKKEN